MNQVFLIAVNEFKDVKHTHYLIIYMNIGL